MKVDKDMGLFSALTVVFVILKLIGYIDWSWWIVISPTILQVILTLILILFVSLTDGK